MTQDKKKIVNTDELRSVEVADNILSKKKSSLFGLSAGGATGVTLGIYDNEKIALDELAKLFDALDNNDDTYEMP
jgi:hypothetical protein